MEAEIKENKVSKNEKIRREILTGNLWKVVLVVTMPLFFYQLINSLYSLVDQIMVAQIGSSEVSAVATLAQIKALISSLGMGLAGGGAIVISRLYGAGKINEAKKNANVIFTLSLLIVAFVIVLMPFSNLILKICKVPDDLIAISSSYFLLQLFEQIIMVFNNVSISFEKSKGNTKIVFVMNIVNMCVKLIFNSIFIYWIKVNNILYVELASILAQASMLAIGLYLMFNKKNIFRIEFKQLSLKWKYVKNILVMSLPLFLGKFVISLGKVGVNALCGVYGSLTVGALGISNNISGLISNCGSSFEDSQSSIVSQNLGNKNMKRTFKVFGVCCAIMSIWTIVGFLCVRVFFEDQIIGLFNTENTSLEFTNMIKEIFKYDCISIPALAINGLVLGILYGYGQTFLATVNNILRIVTRISTLLILQNFFPEIGSEAAGISMGISNGVIAVFSIIFFIIFFIKIKRKGYKGMHLNDPEPEMIEHNGILIRKEELAEIIESEKGHLNESSNI